MMSHVMASNPICRTVPMLVGEITIAVRVRMSELNAVSIIVVCCLTFLISHDVQVLDWIPTKAYLSNIHCAVTVMQNEVPIDFSVDV